MKSTCILCQVVRWLAHRFCKQMLWNRNMSLEIDRLKFDNEQLRERLSETVWGENDHR